MNSSTAVEYVRNLVFKPGWRVTAESYGPGHVYLTMYIDTVDTSYPDPDGVCRKTITLVRERRVETGNLDLEGLCYQVISLGVQTDVHEDREFLKVRQPDGSWHAPLHPHTREGNRAWLDNLQKDADVSQMFV